MGLVHTVAIRVLLHLPHCARHEVGQGVGEVSEVGLSRALAQPVQPGHVLETAGTAGMGLHKTIVMHCDV